jgi:hypothetical protein
MKHSALLLAAASLGLIGCGQNACDNGPFCADPVVYARRNEIQPNFSVPLAQQRLTLRPGEQQTLAVTVDRRGLPDSLPVFFTATAFNSGATSFYRTVTGTVLLDYAGLMVVASANPVTGNTAELTFKVAAGTPPQRFDMTFGTQKQDTRWGSSSFFGISVEAVNR